MNAGRPPKKRIPGSGDKLRRALEILGWSWGKNSATPQHVLQSARWAQCSLPRSVNTLCDDLRLGLPTDRLAGYATFLDIPLELLENPAITAGSMPFIQAVFAAREQLAALDLPLFTVFNKEFCRQFYNSNRNDYIKSLFSLLRGLYTVHLLFPPAPEIHCGCALIHTAEEHLLRLRAFLHIQGADIVFDGGIFRWGNNLHIVYYSTDMFVFGRLIAVDPLRQFSLSHRTPFSLPLSGVSDAIIGQQTYGIIHGRAELADRTPFPAIWDCWERACRKTRRHPVIVPTDPRYARIRKQLAAVVRLSLLPVKSNAP